MFVVKIKFLVQETVSNPNTNKGKQDRSHGNQRQGFENKNCNKVANHICYHHYQHLNKIPVWFVYAVKTNSGHPVDWE